MIVGVLMAAAGAAIPRQQVRDTARTKIGDTGLLDFVLKVRTLSGRPIMLRTLILPFVQWQLSLSTLTFKVLFS